MYIWGKILGAAFGNLVAGPIGLLIGVFVGHLFDKGLAANEQVIKPNVSIAQQVFFKTTFMVMGYIAKADGRISESEIQMARTIMDNMRLDQKQKLEAMNYFNAGKWHDFNFEAIMDNFIRNCGHQRQLMQMFIDIQMQAAFVDGIQNPYKRFAIERLCDKLHIPRIVIEQMQARQYYSQQTYRERASTQGRRSSYSSSSSSSYQKQSTYEEPSHQDELARAYTVLGVSRSMSDAVIKKAYRKLMSKNHPDKLVAKGLPEAMIKIATEKTQAIQRAYDVVCQSRGMR